VELLREYLLDSVCISYFVPFRFRKTTGLLTDIFILNDILTYESNEIERGVEKHVELDNLPSPDVEAKVAELLDV
jgi:hypothetical protein